MPTFLKKCPNCGHRFKVERTGKRVMAKKEVVTVEEPTTPMTPMVTERIANEAVVKMSSTPPDTETVAVEEDTYVERFRCDRCGYTWTEDTSKLRNLRDGTVEGRVVSEGAP